MCNEPLRIINFRSSHRRCSIKKAVLKNFAQFLEIPVNHFRPEFDGILHYFSPPQLCSIHLRVNKPEKENPTKTCKVVLVSQVKS